MSNAGRETLAWGLGGLLLLAAIGFVGVVPNDAATRHTQAVAKAVAGEVIETPPYSVAGWTAAAANITWALFIFLLLFLGCGLWCFVSRVAVADSDLLPPCANGTAGADPIPRPDQLPLEGD